MNDGDVSSGPRLRHVSTRLNAYLLGEGDLDSFLRGDRDFLGDREALRLLLCRLLKGSKDINAMQSRTNNTAFLSAHYCIPKE